MMPCSALCLVQTQLTVMIWKGGVVKAMGATDTKNELQQLFAAMDKGE